MPIRYNQIAIYALYMMIPAIIYSKALITICYVIIVLMGILSFITNRSAKWDAHLGALLLIGIPMVLSGINSANFDQWLHHVTIKLPFIIVPVSFMILPRVRGKVILRLHIFLLFVLTVSVMPILMDLALDFESVIDRISMGQPMNTPVEHVKYSMFISYAIVSGSIWSTVYRDQLTRETLWFVLATVIFLFVSLHLMAIRTGLIISYFSLGLLGVYYVMRIKISWRQKMIYGSLAFLLVFALFKTPMIQAKLGYMLYDWSLYKQNGGFHYSDSERLYSINVGFQLWKDHLFMGTGIGDLLASCDTLYLANGRTEILNYPHSQFIFMLAGTGIIGIIIFLLGYLYPLVRLPNKYRLLLIALYTNYTLSFLVENSLERSISVAFFILFVVPLIYQEPD